jgi:hypothetical protein
MKKSNKRTLADVENEIAKAAEESSYAPSESSQEDYNLDDPEELLPEFKAKNTGKRKLLVDSDDS